MASDAHLRYRTCTGPCSGEVFWHRDAGDDCWFCGTPGKPTVGPAIGNQHGHGNAYTERQWAEVRRQVIPA